MTTGALKVGIVSQIARHFPRLWMERELRFRPNHFESEFWLVPIFCDKTKTAVDIGADAGGYSYYMAKYSRNVTAFVPNTDLSAHLRRVLDLWFTLKVQPAASTMAHPASDLATRSATIEEKNDLVCER
jgi:hypothetical protein